MKEYNILVEAERSSGPSWSIFWRKDHNPLSGKTKQRRLCVPQGKEMREIQGVLKNRVRGLSGPLPSATGCRVGISTLDSVLRHQSRFGKRKVFNRFILILDIKSAYRSVDSSKLALVLAKINYKQFSGYKRTIDFLEKFCFDSEYGGVAMGAAASNELFNVYCEYIIDQKIREICDVFNLTYTRYVDDLMISSQEIICKTIRTKIRTIIEEAGFTINDKKAKLYDLRRGPVEVNGIGITYEGKIFLPRRVLNSIRGMIHCALQGKPVSIPRIHGLMGLFKHSTDMSNINSTERKVFEMYEELRNANKKQPAPQSEDDLFDEFGYPY